MTRRHLLSLLAAAITLPAAEPTTADLFATDRLHEIRLQVDPTDWQTLRDNFRLNDWYWCRMQWNGMDVKAAMRSRGNGSRNAIKPGLKLSFKRSADSGPFLGLDSLVLGNLAQDDTGLKNGLSFELYRRMGIVTPRLSYARVYLNGEYFGLYTLVEEIDDAFLTSRFGRKDGYLYEYSWVDTYYFGERGDNAEAYLPEPFDPKTNFKNPDFPTMAKFIEAINRSQDGEFTERLSQYLDIDRFLTFLAVETYTDDRDTILGEWGLNNFFLHRPKDSTRFMFLPWDKDFSFFEWKRPILENAAQNVMVRRLMARPAIKAQFMAKVWAVTALAGGAGGWLEDEARRRHLMIYQSAVTDPHRIWHFGSVEEMTARTMEFIQRRAEKVNRQLAGLDHPSGDIL